MRVQRSAEGLLAEIALALGKKSLTAKEHEAALPWVEQVCRDAAEMEKVREAERKFDDNISLGATARAIARGRY